MLTHPTIDKLHQLKCLGMAAALTEQFQSTACDALSFEERLGLLVDRELTRSTLVTSQLPLEKWHDLLGDPTFADAILDRLVHNAYKFKLKGGSMRKKKALLTQADH